MYFLWKSMNFHERRGSRRFQFTGTCYEKLTQSVQAPQTLDLGAWIGQRPDGYRVENALYDLYGVATHQGGMSGGPSIIFQ